jgi:formyltetrahydrofolate-dependent phosphoribosylglycinamide formyltransferase
VSELKVGFLVSGNGTLFEYLTVEMQAGRIEASPAVLVSSTPRAVAIERAVRLNVPHEVVRREDYASEDEFSAGLLEVMDRCGVNFLCLAGYLKLVPGAVVGRYHNRILNIHPALLPAFGGKGMYGRKVFETALEYGVRIHGATVHLVDDVYDHGPIVLQRAVFVSGDDTVESLQARVHDIEFGLYADAIRLFASDRIRVEGRRVQILPMKN